MRPGCSRPPHRPAPASNTPAGNRTQNSTFARSRDVPFHHRGNFYGARSASKEFPCLRVGLPNQQAPGAGIEPATTRVRAWRSTSELPRVNSPYGSRTHLATLRGWGHHRTPNGPKAAVAGVEPALVSLTGSRLTIGLHRNINKKSQVCDTWRLHPSEVLPGVTSADADRTGGQIARRY